MKKTLIILIITYIIGLLIFPILVTSSSMVNFILENPVVLFIAVLVVFLLAKIIADSITKPNKWVFRNNIKKENVLQEFEDIYQQLYRDNISGLESMRKQARWRTVIQYAIPLLIFIVGFKNQSVFMVALIIFIALIFINSKYISKYKETYKSEIIAKFIKLINNKLVYKSNSQELLSMEDDYKKASFDNKVFNRFYPDDYIEGLLNNEFFVKMSDLHIQHHVKSGKHSHTYEVFQGIFVQTGCNKDIGTYIKISKNQLKMFGQQYRVEMDSQEFEKYFDIYSENKMITMQLLTSDVMAILIDFYNKYNVDYEIVIRNNKIYMRFFTGAMFEPKIFGNSMDKELLLRYYCILKFIVDVTKEVNKALKEVEI